MDLSKYREEEIIRVIYHEMGHFYAMEINQELGVGYGVEMVEIYPFKESFEELGGHTKPLKPDDVEEKGVKVEHLAHYFARLVMGCIFQCYYQGLKIEECYSGGRCNGRNDFENREGKLQAYLLKHGFRMTLNRLEESFLSKLINNRVLNFLETIELQKTLSYNEISNVFEVNLDIFRGLKENDDYIKFANLYKDFVTDIDIALKKDLESRD